uniref:DUF4378 domain-containing protein n=1 Tax=Strongyloides venezuelensis TaxID=75913 RepID=A0A0K0F7C9_STRVS
MSSLSNGVKNDSSEMKQNNFNEDIKSNNTSTNKRIGNCKDKKILRENIFHDLKGKSKNNVMKKSVMNAIRDMKMNFHRDLKDLQKHLSENIITNNVENTMSKDVVYENIQQIKSQNRVSDDVVIEPSEKEKTLLDGSSLVYEEDDFKNQSLFNYSLKNDEESLIAQFADIAIKSASRSVRESLAKNERLSLNTSDSQFLTKMPPMGDSPRNSIGNIFQKSFNRSGMDSLFGLDMSGATELNEMQKVFDDVSFNSTFDFEKSLKNNVFNIKTDIPVVEKSSSVEIDILQKEKLGSSLYPLDDETVNLILQIFTTILWEAFESNNENKIKNVPLNVDSDDVEEVSVYGDIVRWLTLQFYRKRYSFSNYQQYFNKIVEGVDRMQNTGKYRSDGLQPGDIFADGTILDMLAVDQIISEYSYNLLNMMDKGELDDFTKK